MFLFFPVSGRKGGSPELLSVQQRPRSPTGTLDFLSSQNNPAYKSVNLQILKTPAGITEHHYPCKSKAADRYLEKVPSWKAPVETQEVLKQQENN